MQVDGCNFEVAMAEQDLNGAQVRSGFKKMCGEIVSNQMRARRLAKAGLPGCFGARKPHRLVADGLLRIAMLAGRNR